MQRIAVEPQQIQANRLALNLEQQHYLHRVLRLTAGDRFIVMDGRGNWWETVLVCQEDGAFGGELQQKVDRHTELPLRITLLAALPKGSGFDEVVRQTTELGVTEIVPVLSQRTLLKPSANKLQRWQRIATEAAEQSERQVVPPVREPLKFEAAIASWRGKTAYLCVARDLGMPLRTVLMSQLPELEELAIAIGPEGGWTPQEIQQAQASGFQAVSLGRRILRAVTAPTAALAVIGAMCEDFEA